MAPEVAGQLTPIEKKKTGKENEGYSFEIDIWGIAMITYEMLSGKIPHDKCKSFDMINKLKSDNPIPILKEPTIHNSNNYKKAYYNLEPLFEACTRKDPYRRPTINNILRYLSDFNDNYLI
jgi:serine/threonine protein kinase